MLRKLQLLGSALALGGLLGQKVLVNVGQNTTLGNGDMSKKLVQLLIVSDGELQMSGNDTSLLVVTSGVTGQFENFSSKVLEDSSKVHGGTGTDTLSVVALSQDTVDTANGESETGLGRTGLRGLRARSSLTTGFTTRHY